MFQSSRFRFCSGQNSLSSLYSELSTLNNQVVISLDDIRNSEDRAKKFLAQYIDKSGPMYDQVVADAKDPFATRIRALATNIEVILKQQAAMKTPSTIITSSL